MSAVTFMIPDWCNYFYGTVACTYFISISCKGSVSHSRITLETDKRYLKDWTVENVNTYKCHVSRRQQNEAVNRHEAISSWNCLLRLGCGTAWFSCTWFWKIEEKCVLSGHWGIRRLMRKWRALYAWNTTLFDALLHDTKGNKSRKGSH